jgi:hypothetical protein
VGLNFVPIPTFSLLDCFAEGITTLFAFFHIPSLLALVKYGGLCFPLCANSHIYPWFLVVEGFNSHSGYNISYELPDKLIHHIGICVDIIF